MNVPTFLPTLSRHFEPRIAADYCAGRGGRTTNIRVSEEVGLPKHIKTLSKGAGEINPLTKNNYFEPVPHPRSFTPEKLRAAQANGLALVRYRTRGASEQAKVGADACLCPTAYSPLTLSSESATNL